MVWMKIVLAAVLLVGVAQSVQFPGWKPKRSYYFSIEGKTVTGLPQLREQFSGVEYNGTLLLETHAPNVLLLKFMNMEYDVMNGDLPGGWWSDSSTSSYNETQPLPLTKSTIVVQLENHFVKQVVVPNDLRDWELNFIKGFVKSFFPNFDGKRIMKDKNYSISKSESPLDLENSFSVMEETVVGKCEVQYEILMTPRAGEGWPQSWNHTMKKSACDKGDLFEITRTHNYRNCEYLAETRFALPKNTVNRCNSGDSGCDQVWNRASVSRIRGCIGQNGFVILDSTTSSSVSANLQLHGESKAIIHSKLKTTLVDPASVSPNLNSVSTTKVSLPKDPVHIQDFFYTFSNSAKNNCKRNRSEDKQPKRKNNQNNSDENRYNHNSSEKDERMPYYPSSEDENVESSKKSNKKTKNDEEKSSNTNGKFDDFDNESSNNEEDFDFKGKGAMDNNVKNRKGKKKNAKTPEEEEKFNGSDNNNDEYNNFNHSNEENVGNDDDYNKNKGKKLKGKRNFFADSMDRSFLENEKKNFNQKVKRSQNMKLDNGESSWESKKFTSQKHFNAWNVHAASMNDPDLQPLNPFSLSFGGEGISYCAEDMLDEQIRNIAKDIMAGTVSPEGALTEKISIAIDISRMLSFEELESLSDSFMESENKIERIIFRDVVASSGTKPSLKTLDKWIDSNQISNEESIDILRLLPEKLMFADKETFKFYFRLVQKVASRGDSALSSAAVIGFSNFVRVACIDEKSMMARFNHHLYNDVCQPSHVDDLIQWLYEKLEDDSSSFKIYTSAIGNTGAKSAIEILMGKAADSNLSAYKRLSSIFALKQQVFFYPRLLAPHLLRLYSNYSNPASVRISAFSMLVYTRPPISIWQRFAISTWFEKNIVVNSFVQTTIQSFSKRENEAFAEIIKASSIVLPLMKPFDNMMHMKAFNSIKTSTIRELETAVFEQNSWIGLANVMSLYNMHSTKTNEFSSLIEAELTSANPDGLLTAVKDFLMLSDDVSQTRPPIPNLKRSTRWIHNFLGIVARKPPQLEGDIHIRMNRLVEYIYPFDRKTQISIVKWGRKMMTQLLLGRLQYDHLKLDMTSSMLSTTTEMGFPVRLQMRLPSIMQFNGSADLVQNNALNSSLEFLYSTGMNTDLSFFTPWDRTTFAAGVIGSCFVQIPKIAIFHKRLNKSQMVQLSSNSFDKSKVLHHSTLPFTSLRRAEFMTKPFRRNTETRYVHSGEKKERNIDLMSDINLRYRTEGEMMTVARALKNIQVMSNPFLIHHSMKVTQLDVTVDEMYPVSFNFSLSKALKRNGEIGIRSSDEIPSNDNSKNEVSTTVSTAASSGMDTVALNISKATTGSNVDGESTESPDISNNESNPEESTSSPSTSSSTTTHPGTQTTESSQFNTSTSTMKPTAPSQEEEEVPQSKGIFQSVKDFFKNIFGGSKKDDDSPLRASSSQKVFNGSQLEIHDITYSIDGNSFNASSLDLFNGNQDPSELLLVKVLEGLSSGSASVVNIDVVLNKPGAPVKYSTYWTYGTSSMKNIKRLGSFFKRNSSSMQGGLTSTLELPLLPAYDLEAIVLEKKRPKFYVDVINKYDSNRSRKLSIQGDMSYKAYNMQNSDSIDECQKPKSIAHPHCRKRYEAGSSIEKYSLNMSADDKSGWIQWVLHKTITAGAAIITGNEQYEFVDDRNQPDSNSLQLDVIVDKEKKTLNSRVSIESAEVLLKKVPFPFINEPSIAMTLYSEMEQQFNSDYCGISYSGISTFDRVQVDYNLTRCWHLATKDCSGKSRIAVLARRAQNNIDLDLEINLDNYKVINIIDGSIQIDEKNVTINKAKTGAAIADKAGTELIRIERSLDYGLFINLPAHGFHVIYTNTSAVIHTSSKMQNRLCGLCGDFNSEEYGEFSTPKGSRAHDSQQFASSYKIKESDCQ